MLNINLLSNNEIIVISKNSTYRNLNLFILKLFSNNCKNCKHNLCTVRYIFTVQLNQHVCLNIIE